MFALFSQFPAGDESVNASLHDLGVDVLRGHHHQGRGLREGGTAQGDHEDHGTEQWHPVAQLVHQQFNPTPDQRWLVGDVIEGWCCHRHARIHVYTLSHHAGMSANCRKQVGILTLITTYVYTNLIVTLFFHDHNT